MRKILLLTMVLILAVGLVYAWGVDKTSQQQPAPTTIKGQAGQTLDKSSTQGPTSVTKAVDNTTKAEKATPQVGQKGSGD